MIRVTCGFVNTIIIFINDRIPARTHTRAAHFDDVGIAASEWKKNVLKIYIYKVGVEKKHKVGGVVEKKYKVPARFELEVVGTRVQSATRLMAELAEKRDSI